MNRRIISPIHLAILMLMAFVPAVYLVPVRAQGFPTVAVDPSSIAADVGETFVVAVTLADVMNLYAYDVTLTYDTTGLDLVAVDYDTGTLGTTVFVGRPHFNTLPSSEQILDFDNTLRPVLEATGRIRYAVTLVGQISVNVITPRPLLIVSFLVTAPRDSPLNIVDDQIVQITPSGPVNVVHQTFSGNFLVPPVILFRVHGTVDPSDRQKFVSKGETSLTLKAFIELDPNAARAAFGSVQFTVTDPDGVTYSPPDPAPAFMFPGERATLSAPFDFGTGPLGTWKVSVTALRCAFPDACVLGQSEDGLFFKVHF